MIFSPNVVLVERQVKSREATQKRVKNGRGLPEPSVALFVVLAGALLWQRKPFADARILGRLLDQLLAVRFARRDRDPQRRPAVEAHRIDAHLQFRVTPLTPGLVRETERQTLPSKLT